MFSAEIIAIGTELLLGETADTNTRFIAQALRGLGIDLFRTTTVGDNTGRIARVIYEALTRAEIVITTGGLGPTVDDPTRQAVAYAMGVELEFQPVLWEQIIARLSRFGRVSTENQKRQAYIPKGAIAIGNPVGTAPAFIMGVAPISLTGGGSEVRSSVVIALPGVPREMETLLTQAVIPYLQKHYNTHLLIKIRTLHTGGISEASIDEIIGDLEGLCNPTVGLSAHSGIIDIRIAAKARDETEAVQMIEPLETDIRSRLGSAIYGVDDDTLESVALHAVALRGWTLACLESGLDGLLIKRLAATKDRVYIGGSRLDIHADVLEEALEGVRREKQSSVALGVILSASEELSKVTIFVLTPPRKEVQRLDYGGHPREAARWATNMGLDALRRSALGFLG